jgi:multidrug transporter EmrE-like cation transporter
MNISLKRPLILVFLLSWVFASPLFANDSITLSSTDTNVVSFAANESVAQDVPAAIEPSDFQNLFSKSEKPLSASLFWSRLENFDGQLIIRYKSKASKTEPWQYTQPIAANENQYFLDSLGNSTEYEWQLGAIVGTTQKGEPEYVWSASKDKFETSSSYNLWNVLGLLGALGVFIFGMKIMSEGLQKMAGDQLRKILKSMTSTRVSGIFTGALVTSVIQSSSATTVMVVSFVNAGLLTLTESMGVIMGANIGTTITAWMVAYFGFKEHLTPVNIAGIALAVAAIVVLTMV